MQNRQEQGIPLDVPDVGPGGYLIAAMFNAGPTLVGAEGDRALDWPAVAAFAGFTGAISEPWEARALIDMSRAYLTGRTAGADGLSLPPAEWED